MQSRDRRWRHRATSMRLFVEVVVLSLAVTLWRVATEEVVDIRPAWMPLEGHGQGDEGTSVAEVFRSSEVLQMYHLQVGAVIYDAMGTRPRSHCWSRCAIVRVLGIHTPK